MLAVAAMQTASMRGDMLSSRITEALRSYNQDKAEELLAQAYGEADLSDAVTGAETHGPATAMTANGMTYTTSWTVEQDVPYSGAKTVRVTTMWTDQFGSHNVTTSFIKDSVL